MGCLGIAATSKSVLSCAIHQAKGASAIASRAKGGDATVTSKLGVVMVNVESQGRRRRCLEGYSNYGEI